MKTKHNLLLIVCLSTVYAQAQNDKSEELTKSKSGADMVVKGSATDMYEGTTSEKAMAFYRQAVQEHQSGDLAAAKKTYAKALKEDPKFVEVYDNLGQVHRQDGEYELAIKNYNKSLELYPQGLMARQNLAVVHSIRGDHTSALEQYEAIIQHHPESAEGYFGMANVLMTQKQLAPALVQAQKALDIYTRTSDPHLVDGYYIIGLIHYYNEDIEQARPFLEQARDLGAKIHPQVAKEVLGAATPNKGAPETAEDYAAMVPEVVNAFDWLYGTPVTTDPEKRKTLSAGLIQWITGSPMVSIELKKEVVPYVDQPECLMIYLGGYTKYVLQVKDDNVEANIYATERVLEFYEKNRTSLGKNKELEKLLKMKSENKLKGYIKANS